MSVLTIFCCGTGSNSFDASRWGRTADHMDGAGLTSRKPPGAVKAGRGAGLSVFDERVKAKGWSDPLVQKTVAERLRSQGDGYAVNNYFQGEVVSSLAQQHRGREFSDWIQIDGPGSGNLKQHLLWVNGPMHGNITGNALGWGLQANVAHALAVIKNTPATGQNGGITSQALQSVIASKGRARAGGHVTKVNLVGWSRGAITCIAIANAVANDPGCAGIEVNIFAVDPVPGALAETVSWQKTQIPACVKEFFGVYARDEVSIGFNPVIPRLMSGNTRLRLLPLPGMHASVAGNSHVDKNSREDSQFNLEQPGRITRYWAERKLIEWGSELSRTAMYGSHELLSMYQEMVLLNPEFLRMQNYSYTGLRQGNLSVFRKFYVSGSGYISNYWSLDQLGNSGEFQKMRMMFRDQPQGPVFVNWHHKMLHDAFS